MDPKISLFPNQLEFDLGKKPSWSPNEVLTREYFDELAQRWLSNTVDKAAIRKAFLSLPGNMWQIVVWLDGLGSSSPRKTYPLSELIQMKDYVVKLGPTA